MSVGHVNEGINKVNTAASRDAAIRCVDPSRVVVQHIGDSLIQLMRVLEFLQESLRWLRLN